MFERLNTYGSFIRFSHSVFALPFALTGVLLASRHTPVTITTLLWIIAAMVSARAAAMGFNRLVDSRYDALNSRTADREMPRGVISKRAGAVFVIFSSIIFMAVTFQLSWLCFILSPVALSLVFWYSLAKRYTAFTQLFLGLAMAVAPIGGWLAAGGRGGLEPWLLGLAIGAWVAGFDVLYACQDFDFDRKCGLRSIPARYGIQAALTISRSMHVIAVTALASLVMVVPLGVVYLTGVASVGALLAYEQSLVKANDLSRIKQAFDLNGYVGFVYLLVTAVALYVD